MLFEIPISLAPNFNQRLLNFNEYLASDVDHMLFARSAYEQRHLHSSTNFTMNKIKPVTLTVGTVKTILWEYLKGLLQIIMHFHILV